MKSESRTYLCSGKIKTYTPEQWEEHKRKAREWYAANKERANSANKENYKRRREDGELRKHDRNLSTERMRKWRAANPERAKAIQAAYRKANPGKRKTAVLRWRANNRDKHLAIKRASSMKSRMRNLHSERERNRLWAVEKTRQRRIAAGIELGRPEAGHCESCKRPCRPVLDHNHVSNKWRGWLCANCNSALGFLNGDDGPDKLTALIAYLDRSLTK